MAWMWNVEDIVVSTRRLKGTGEIREESTILRWLKVTGSVAMTSKLATGLSSS